MVINIRPVLHSNLNILSKFSVLTSLAVQWLGLHVSLEGEPVQSLVGELRYHKVDGASHPKTISLCHDHFSNLDQDLATSTVLPLITHCSHKLLRITVT